MRDKVIRLLDDYGIEYSVAGKNISKKAIAGINCPFCEDDEGKHLGIMEWGYTCWKNSEHKGSLPNLFSKLLGISFAEAKVLFKEKSYVEDDFFLDIGNKICYNNNMIKIYGKRSYLEMPKYFKPVDKGFMGKIFYSYLKGRGFDVEGITSKYDIRFCIRGEWAYRVIFPIYQDGRLLSWVGRTVDKNVELRYRETSLEESVRQPKFCLFNFDNLTGGGTLYITEGIMDAIKLDYYGNPEHHATAILTTSITDEQIALLLQKSPLYKRVVLVLDKETELQLLNLLDRLSFIRNISWASTPFNAKDPGELTKEQVEIFER